MNDMKSMVATGKMKYRTRRLLAGDEFEAKKRDARVLIAAKLAKPATKREPVTIAPPPAALRHKVAETQAPAEPADDALTAAREAFRQKFGRNPFWKWDVETLQAKIAEA